MSWTCSRSRRQRRRRRRAGRAGGAGSSRSNRLASSSSSRDGRRQPGQVLGDLAGLLGRQRRPRRRPLGVLLDPARRCGRTRKLSRFMPATISCSCRRCRAQPALGMPSVGCSASARRASRAVTRPSRASKSRCVQRLLERALGPGQVLAEELEVLAEVEDVEVLLVLARAEQVRAQPRAAADHLPELGLRAHQLEEHEVDDLRHVDAGVEHVDRDRDVRRLVLDRRSRRSGSARTSVLKVMTRAKCPA